MADLRTVADEGLRDKAASLGRELERWREQAGEGDPLRKHHTQMRAIAQALAPALAGIEAKAVTAADRSALEGAMLEVHRVWDFFRGKLAQRYAPGFGSFLAAADAFAWACFEPTSKRLPDPGREPPLVYLNGGWSPFTMPRTRAYQAESVVFRTPLREPLVLQALQALPVAVIGVPWYHLEHLPDLPVVGHEVGHDVEQDLDLADEVDAVVDRALADAGVPDDRRAAWKAWGRETFADVYGTLATGPVYAGTLGSFVLTTPEAVARERIAGPPWGAYPSRALRVHLICAALEHVGLADHASARLQEWHDVFPAHGMPEYDDDAAIAATALIDGPYPALGGVGLRTLVDFDAARQTAAERAAQDMLDRTAPESGDVRVLIAAARLAFEQDAAAYRASEVPRRVLARIAKVEGRSTRAGGTTGPTEAERDERDLDIGAQLADLLL